MGQVDVRVELFSCADPSVIDRSRDRALESRNRHDTGARVLIEKWTKALGIDLEEGNAGHSGRLIIRGCQLDQELMMTVE